LSEKWPNFFIVGAPKAGTTSLYEYLKQIPGVYMSPEKEPRYFSPNYPNPVGKTIVNKQEYLKLFSASKDEKIIGEATPIYLRDPDAARAIHETIPGAKILILLRDPVERAFSHYLFLISLGIKIKHSFHEIINMDLELLKKEPIIYGILSAGLYYEQVKLYMDFFGINVKIIIFEEFIKEPKKTVEDVLRFCGIEYTIPNFKADEFNKFAVPRFNFVKCIINNSTIRKIINSLTSSTTRLVIKEKVFSKNIPKPKLSEEDKVYLQNFYKEDVQKLKKILDKQFQWKNS
jgi:hypothetical protein